jgi:hypothetical protein
MHGLQKSSNQREDKLGSFQLISWTRNGLKHLKEVESGLTQLGG